MPEENEARLRELNEQYLRAYMTADVSWYERHLTDDFLCRRADGTVLDKRQFLNKTAEGPDVTEYRLERVRVRIGGDIAAIDGTGSFTMANGTKGTSRYTDVYRRIDGEWKAVSAEIARTTHARQAAS